ncbi:Adiponectin receptor protein 1, partial [Nowakowskiella sp. JEL0078]
MSVKVLLVANAHNDDPKDSSDMSPLSVDNEIRFRSLQSSSSNKNDSDESTALKNSSPQNYSSLSHYDPLQTLSNSLENAGAALEHVFQSLTVAFQDLPNWRQDNMYVLTGYWHTTGSYIGCLKSLFFVHNETGNIYTHLVGTMTFSVFLFISFQVFTPVFESTKWSDVLVVSLFLFGGVVCLALSTLFHLFQCHSVSVCQAWNKADYIGIVVLIVSSFIPTIYYGFLCNITAQIALSVSSKFSKPEFRILRTGMFLGMGLSGILPLVHASIIYGFDFMLHAMSAEKMMTMGALYVVGALIFASRVPERWWPGKFDIW